MGDKEADLEFDRETFMNCVCNYKVIYDKNSKDFKIPLKKNNAWKEISLALGIEVDEAKRGYNTIRTRFSKYIRKLRSVTSGSGRDAVPEIKGEFEHLRWLLTYVKHRQGSTNFRRRVSISPAPISSTESDEEEPDQENIFEEEEYREDVESRPMEIETQQTQNEIDDGHEQGVQESINVNVIDESKDNVPTRTSSTLSISTGITRSRPTRPKLENQNSKQKIIAFSNVASSSKKSAKFSSMVTSQLVAPSYRLLLQMETLVCDDRRCIAGVRTKPSKMHRRHFPGSNYYMETRL